MKNLIIIIGTIVLGAGDIVENGTETISEYLDFGRMTGTA